MNLTRDLRKEPLPIGFYNICGEQGAGKTSLAIALFRTDYKRWRKYRYELALSFFNLLKFYTITCYNAVNYIEV